MASTPCASTGSLPEPGRAGGYLRIAGAALCWGFAASLAKFLFVRNVPPLVLAQVRAGFSFLVLLAIALAARRSMLRVTPAQAAGLALLGTAGIAASNFTYLMAIHRTSVTTAILLQYTAPVWVMLYAVLFAGDRLSGLRALAAMLSVGGCVLAVGGYRPGGLAWNAAGVAWGLGAAFSFSFFNIWGGRMARRVELWTSLLYALGAATLFWAAVHSPVRLVRSDYSTGQWALLFFYATLSVLVPYSLFYSGLRRVPPAHAIVTSTLEPPFAMLFAFLLVGEPLGAVRVVGMAAVVTAVILVSRRN